MTTPDTHQQPSSLVLTRPSSAGGARDTSRSLRGAGRLRWLATALAALLFWGSRASFAAPTMVVIPSVQDPLDLGQTPLGQDRPWVVTVFNDGPAELVITDVKITGADAAEFSLSVTRPTCQGTAIAAPGSCSIWGDFIPTRSGNVSANLVISDNASDSPQVVPITATVPPDLPPQTIAVRNHGGPVIQSPQVVSVYFGSFWEQPDGQKIAGDNDAFLRAILNSAYMRGLREYGVGTGSLVGTFTDASAQIPLQVTDEQLVNELSARISDGSLPRPAFQPVPWPNSQTIFFLFTPPGMVVHLGNQDTVHDFGAYHAYSAGSNFTRAVIPWPNERPPTYIPWQEYFHGPTLPPIPPANIGYWMMTPLISHELAEACTDPQLSNGWRDDTTGQEIADLPISLAAAGRASYDDVYQWLVSADGTLYLVQKYWSQGMRSIFTMGD